MTDKEYQRLRERFWAWQAKNKDAGWGKEQFAWAAFLAGYKLGQEVGPGEKVP